MTADTSTDAEARTDRKSDPVPETDGRGETELARLTQWLRQRPNSIELWELVVTDERLVWCFVGESYRSMLLRADMGQRDRALVDDSGLEELLDLDEANFAVPLERLESIRLTEGTRFRRARLEIEWDDRAGTRYDGSVTLVSTSDADSQRERVAALAEEPRLEGVAVGVESPRWSLF
ncbi:hypothetical protein Htur_1944 [Haloterrigena turkmenica DSM 5511]|uniref:Uncharacterized protein n=1 Tax=Haloterrigena turkmenica (strain ATCC 51198 / DSM 5511 / JCM 9101 / NCIMB 13204 / VKM B-1734 / 4k) TaxID=543526 RepID=D2RSQ3_HALTV|nr:hypothetical protein [Haloterrigena turkmenica]ADB60829.1 hypothetical protein Htur_1944 [Haloterrigena turkmenica DSM 5511]